MRKFRNKALLAGNWRRGGFGTKVAPTRRRGLILWWVGDGAMRGATHSGSSQEFLVSAIERLLWKITGGHAGRGHLIGRLSARVSKGRRGDG